MLEITAVEPDSIGAELDLEAGDCVLAVNGQAVRDILDFQIYAATEDLLLEVRKRDGELWDLEIEKDAPDLLGLHFEHPEPTQCGNNCIFCFVHQLPRGMRSTLYVKDEDYRFSYLYGSYVTLTNIGEEEIERIVTQKLSPLYVSVHATEEQLRQKLIGRPGPPILDLLKKLTTAGIEIHTQIVLCPGYNDGQELERTVEDLQGLYPGVRSLAVVPVGLTGYRQRLPQLRPPGADEARSVLDTLHGFQDRFLAQTGSRFVHAADELYLTAGTEFPELGNYEDLAQLENGVGMIPLFRAEAAEVLAEAEPLKVPVVSTITGESAYPELARFIGALCAKIGVDIHLYPVRNEFFGGHVSVTGLLTGQDIIAQLRGGLLGEFLLVPDVMLKDVVDVFLDDLSLLDLERELGVHVSKVSSTPWGILEGIEDLAADFRQNPDPDRK
jgi:putative radical SAM enzyme (TIGR03279 family)